MLGMLAGWFTIAMVWRYMLGIDLISVLNVIEWNYRDWQWFVLIPVGMLVMRFVGYAVISTSIANAPKKND